MNQRGTQNPESETPKPRNPETPKPRNPETPKPFFLYATPSLSTGLHRAKLFQPH